MARIENLSDQLGGYVNKVYYAVKGLRESHDELNLNQAIDVVKIATYDMMADCLHHINEEGLHNIDESIYGLANIISEK